MSRQRFSELISKYKSNKYSSAEQTELFDLIATGHYENDLSQSIELDLDTSDEIAALHPEKAQKILQDILATSTVAVTSIRKLPVRTKILRLAAAAITGVIALGAYFMISNKAENPDKQIASTLRVKSSNTKKNDNQFPQKIQLEDGSSVTLQPGSSLYYANHFPAEKREVYLDGEAFFEISKNPQRPFFVYHNSLVTQVLGTSFNVKTNKSTNNVEVKVKTVRVQVFEQLDSVSGSNRHSNGVILTPNQKVLYVAQNSLFVPMLVDAPLPIQKEQSNQPLPPRFIYDRVSVAAIIADLEKNYEIEIIPENTAIGNCLFTGVLTTPNLFTKLDVLCTVIKATYEVKGTQILLKGKGCS